MGNRGRMAGAVDVRPRKGATPCWTEIGGHMVRGFSVTDLARKLDVSASTLLMAIKYARGQGRTEVVTLGYRIHFDDTANGEKDDRPTVTGRSDGPLLYPLCTHRLGAYRGGDW